MHIKAKEVTKNSYVILHSVLSDVFGIFVTHYQGICNKQTNISLTETK